MQFILNGHSHQLDNSLTVAELIDELALEGKLAIEVNEEILPRSAYADYSIRPGDRIEVVQAVGGG